MGDLVCDWQVACSKVHVVGDENFTGSNSCRSRGRVDFLGSIIRPPGRVFSDFVTELLELSSSNIGKITPVWSGSCFFVQEDWNVELFCKLLSKPSRQCNAILHHHPGQRDKGDDVHSAHSRVFTLVMVQVDKLDSLSSGGKRGFFDRSRLPNKTDHTTVMVRVRFDI